MVKKLSDKIHQFVGEWAWFVGSVMADAFEARMQEIAEQEEATAENELMKLKSQGKRVN